MYSYSTFTELRGPRLNLKRLQKSDLDDAFQSLFSPTTWAVAARGVNTRPKFDAYLESFIEKDARGEGLGLVARLNSNNEVVGFSRYHSAGPNFSKVEIGYTWISDRWQRSFVNTEKKQLMLTHAFDEMGVKRTEFSVDPVNDKSNKAMLRLGAKFEGTLRKWRFLSERDRGDRNIYSIIDDEWPQIRGHLQGLQAKRCQDGAVNDPRRHQNPSANGPHAT